MVRLIQVEDADHGKQADLALWARGDVQVTVWA